VAFPRKTGTEESPDKLVHKKRSVFAVDDIFITNGIWAVGEGVRCIQAMKR
jgi:hypothetical protein